MGMKYEELIKTKSYEDMTEEEIAICIAAQTEKYLPVIKTLREKGYSDVAISAYFIDLYDAYEIYDDVPIVDAAGISDDDYEEAKDRQWNGDPIEGVEGLHDKVKEILA